MRLLPAPTRGDGNCAFHAVFGTWNGQEYVYNDIRALRKEVADKIRAINIASHNLFPSVSEAIKELIRGNNQQITLPPKKFPLVTDRQREYTPDNEDFEDLEKFDPKLNGHIVKEYAKFIETPGMWLLPCELSVIAYALDRTIQQFGKGKHGEIIHVDTYNPGPHTQTVANVYFDGNNHYQAMEVDDSIFTKPSTEIIFDENQTYPILQSEGSHPASGVKLALHGTIYQLKLITWIFHRLHTLQLDALISTEDDVAGKFDDLVIRLNPTAYGQEEDSPKYLYRFFQFKHKQGDEVISYGDLVTSKTGDFSLAKYLRSFLKIKKEQLKKGGRFSDGVLGDFCLCTNIGLDFSPKNTRSHIFSLQDALEEIKEIKEADPLLEGQGRRYRFKNDFKGKDKLYTTLKQNGDEMAALAKALHSCMKDPNNKVDKRQTPFNDKKLYQWLVDENIVDAATKRVTKVFLAGKKLSQEALDFKALYDQGKNAKGNALQDKDIDEFFKHLIFAVSLPNEVELGRHLTQKVGAEFNLLDAKFLSANLLEALLDWMKERSGSFLSTEALRTFFKGMREQLSHLALIGPTLDYQRKLDGSGIVFKPSKCIREFLEGEERVAIYKVPGDLFLGGIRIYQTIKKLPNYDTNDGHIFVTLKKAVRLGSLLIDAFEKSQLLVLSCNIPVEGGAKKLLEDLFKTESTAKIILITLANQDVATAIPSNIKQYKIKANGSFAALSSASKEKLQKHTIRFQGRSLTLADLPNALVTIDEAGLAELLKGTPEVGKPLEIITDSLFVPRTFSYTATIKKKGLNQNNSDIFALSTTMKINKLQTIVGNNNPIRFFTEEETEKQAVENTEPKQEKCANYIILDTDNTKASTQFTQLCNTYPNHTIHYLAYENKHWIWQQSQGSLSGLRPYLADSAKVNKLTSRNVVLAAEPGMGKSWWLANYAQQLKKQYPEAWVFHISLLAQEEKIKQIHFNGINDIITFFTQEASAFARNLFATRLQNTGNLIICLDGFDELQAAQQAKVIQLLQLLKTTKVQRVVVTTRQHLQETLEDTLNTFAYGLIPFEEHDVPNYLQEFWQAELPTENRERIHNYANALVQLFIKTVDEAHQFIGIPLQARLLAEAFVQDVRIFCAQTDQTILTLPNKLSLVSLYQKFIEAKYHIFLQNKSNFPQTNRFALLLDYLIPGLNKDHQYYAFTFLFPDAPAPVEKPTQIPDYIQKAGIIHFIDGQPDFIHRTFAEYFVAQFLTQQLKKPSQHSDHQQYKVFLTHEIFKARNASIKAFIEGFVETAQDSTLHSVWLAICNADFLPKQTRHFVINTKLEATKSTESSTQDPKLPTLAELKDQVLRAQCWVRRDDISAIANSTSLYCKQLLETQDHQTITGALDTLYEVIKSTRLYTVENAIKYSLISLFWHYFLVCYRKNVVFDQNKIEQFINYLANQDPVLTKRLQEISDTPQSYLDPQVPLTDDCTTKLSTRNLISILSIRQSPLSQAISQKLTEPATYDELEYNDTYHALLMQIARKDPQVIKALLLNRVNVKLLDQLSTQQSNMALEAIEIENIFSDGKGLIWLESTGINLVNTFRILTPKMAQVFSKILGKGTDGFYTRYAHNIWSDLLIPLINTFDPEITKPSINRYALFKMYVRFMEFSLKEMTYWVFSPTENGLRNLLVLIQQILKDDMLSSKNLENGVTFLYSLNQYGLVFIDTVIDTKKTLFILDPHSEFSFSLSLPYHDKMKQLLAFKAENPEDKNALKKQCRQAILTIED